MTMRIGMIGLSEGNGHPFSFSAIINGYSDHGLATSGWKVIYDYVKRRDPSEFGFEGVKVTHAWTQDTELTKALCSACLIPNAVADPEQLIGDVDAVIIARDDFNSHFSLAMPFLKAGLHVFVDKPLTLDVKELRAFRPFLESGKLMSCSGMRFARELDEPRATLNEYGAIKLIRGAILNNWEKYGIHLLDAVFGMLSSIPVEVSPGPARHDSVAIVMDDGTLIQIDALGDVGKCFNIEIYGTHKITSHQIFDNFSMFRRLLWHFFSSIRSGSPAIKPEVVFKSLRVLIAGRIALHEKRKVELNEISI